MTKIRIAILGSGSSAFSVAQALSDLEIPNASIDMLDFGQNYNPLLSGGLNSKISKGSVSAQLFNLPGLFGVFTDDESVLGTSVFGGWAEAWGATIVPYNTSYLSEFECQIEDFDEPIRTTHSLLTSSPNSVAPTRIFSPCFDDVFRNQNNSDTTIRPSVLAISSLATSIDRGCTQCGNCLSGCPGKHIWAPSNSWQKLISHMNIKYHPGIWINRFEESSKNVKVFFKNQDGVDDYRTYDIVFCGLGAVQTASLLIRSGKFQELAIQDSQIKYVPFLHRRLKRTSTKKSRISLSEAFLEYRSPDGNNSLNLFAQLYGFSPELHSMILQRMPLLSFIPRIITRFFLSYIGIAMCFFDSEVSGELRVQIEKKQVKISSGIDQKNIRIQKSVIRKAFSKSGLIPLPAFSPKSKVGEGYHLGASITQPYTEGEVSLNRYRKDIFRSNRFHVIDSSVLPAIHETPLTFNVMSNARRIVNLVMLSNGVTHEK